MMAWSEQSMEALRRWAAPGTWHTHHPYEDARFFAFVASVWHDIHGLWDESVAREVMTNEAKKLHSGSDDLITEVVERRKAEGTLILDFLSHVRDEGKFGFLTRD